MAVPTLLPTIAAGESYGGVVYHIDGELVPVLHVEVSAVPVYFEHHILLWKDPSVEIGLKPMKGAFEAVLAGMPIYMTETRGSGAHCLQPGWGRACVSDSFAAQRHARCARSTNSSRPPPAWNTRLPRVKRQPICSWAGRDSLSTRSTAPSSTASCGCTAMETSSN